MFKVYLSSFLFGSLVASAKDLLHMLWKEQEVWAHVASEFDSLKTKTPPGQSDGAIGQAFSLEKVVNALQVGERELRNVACNICWTVPLFESIDGDTLSLQLIEKFAKARFYADGKPKAPRLWPSIVIPIALMQKDDLPPKTTWKRYGGDIAVAAFWYAFAMAKKDGLPGPDLEAFRSLARTSGALCRRSCFDNCFLQACVLSSVLLSPVFLPSVSNQ